MGDAVLVDQFVSQQGGDVTRFVTVVEVPNRSLALLRTDLLMIVKNLQDKPTEMQLVKT